MAQIETMPKLIELIEQHQNGEIILDIYHAKKLLKEEADKLAKIEQPSDIDQEQLLWIKSLEDVLFALNYHLLTPDEILPTFSDLELYNSCITKYVNTKTHEFSSIENPQENLVDRVLLSKIALEKLAIKSEKIDETVFHESLIRKASKIHNRIPYKIKGIDYDGLQRLYTTKLDCLFNSYEIPFEELHRLLNGKLELSTKKATGILLAIKSLNSRCTENTPEFFCTYKDCATKLENYIFLRQFRLIPEEVQENSLVNTNSIGTYFSNFTEQIESELEKQNSFNEKLEFITKTIFTNKELNITSCDNSLTVSTLPIMAVDYLTHRVSRLKKENLQPTISANSFKKIQTTLTVDQLALLFRILKDESIINKNTEVTNLARAISSIFSTKKADDISHNSLKNHFDKPTEDAIKFWLEKKQPIQTHLTKYKEKYSE